MFLKTNKATVIGGGTMSQMGGFVGTHWCMEDVSSPWGLPGRRENIRENSKYEEGVIKRVIREISLVGCFLVHNNLHN